MAHSYSYLCSKAGLPAPGGTAHEPVRVYKSRMTEREKKEWLRVELEKLVASGEFYRTPDGHYGLTEWLAGPPKKSSESAPIC